MRTEGIYTIMITLAVGVAFYYLVHQNYTLFNGFLVAVWAVTNAGGFFWPIFPMAGWGIGLIMNAWDVYRTDEFSEEQIRREMERIQRQV